MKKIYKTPTIIYEKLIDEDICAISLITDYGTFINDLDSWLIVEE